MPAVGEGGWRCGRSGRRVQRSVLPHCSQRVLELERELARQKCTTLEFKAKVSQLQAQLNQSQNHLQRHKQLQEEMQNRIEMIQQGEQQARVALASAQSRVHQRPLPLRQTKARGAHFPSDPAPLAWGWCPRNSGGGSKGAGGQDTSISHSRWAGRPRQHCSQGVCPGLGREGAQDLEGQPGRRLRGGREVIMPPIYNCCGSGTILRGLLKPLGLLTGFQGPHLLEKEPAAGGRVTAEP